MINFLNVLAALYSHFPEVVCDNTGSVGASIIILEDEIWSQIVGIRDS